uniref:Uncharacterized protein n=1 Tax=Trichobilharzia regenti TaxID=157069 RepID=A0AA85JBG2_TRIRE
IVTKEIIPQSSHLSQCPQSSVSLQRLNSSSTINCPPPSCVKSSSLDRTVAASKTAINIVGNHSKTLGSSSSCSPSQTIMTSKSTENNEIQTNQLCNSTTASLSPLDSGLYMSVPNVVSNHSNDDDDDAGGDIDDDYPGVEDNNITNNSNIDVVQSSDNSYHLPRCPFYHSYISASDQTLAMQRFLVPRLIPEWDFVDGLLRIAHRLVPISPKEQR